MQIMLRKNSNAAMFHRLPDAGDRAAETRRRGVVGQRVSNS
jgi:hypothetical protein